MSQSARSLAPPQNVTGQGDSDRRRIDEAIIEAFAEARRGLGGNPRTAPILDAARAFVLSGGKRIRPRLCLASHSIFDGGREPSPAVYRVAAGLEVYHAFMLVHDDLIDRSATRRDRPTLHEAFRASSGLEDDSDARKRGSDLALLAGDLLCALAMRMTARSGLSAAARGRASTIIADMLIETGLGQALDVMNERASLDILDEAALTETYLRKTARYTISGPLVLGAAIAGAGRGARAALDRHGDLLGFAFQIRNDLDSLAEDIERGDHSDLDTGKRTYVLWRAYRDLSPAGRAAMREVLAEPVSISRRRRLLALIQESGAIRRSEAHAARLERAASGAIRKSPMTPDQKRAFLKLTEDFGLKSKPNLRAVSVVPTVTAPTTIGSEFACKP